jgi:hypothetical protein
MQAVEEAQPAAGKVGEVTPSGVLWRFRRQVRRYGFTGIAQHPVDFIPAGICGLFDSLLNPPSQAWRVNMPGTTSSVVNSRRASVPLVMSSRDTSAKLRRTDLSMFSYSVLSRYGGQSAAAAPRWLTSCASGVIFHCGCFGSSVM